MSWNAAFLGNPLGGGPYGGPWVVLWRRGGRLGSRPLSELPQLQEKFRMQLIQRDASGTEHWEVRGEKR